MPPKMTAQQIQAELDKLNQFEGTLTDGAIDQEIVQDVIGDIRGRAQELQQPPTPAINLGGMDLTRAVLPTLGGIAGGVLSSPGVVTTPIGVALGAGAGRGLDELLRSQAGLQPTPQTVTGAAIPVAKEVALTGAFGAGLPLAGRALSGLGSVARKAGQRIGFSNVPQTVAQAEQAITSGAPTVGQELAQRGLFGTRRGLLQTARTNLNKFGTELDTALAEATKQGKRVNINSVVKELDFIKTRLQQTGDKAALRILEKKQADFVSQWIKPEKVELFTPIRIDNATLQGLLNPSEANTIKRLFQKQAKFGTEFFATDSAKKEFAKAISRGLRKEIERLVPKASPINKELAFFGQLSDGIANSLAKDLSKGGISLSQPFTTAGAAIPGVAVGSPVAAMTGAAVVQGSRNLPVRTFLAAMLSKAGAGQEANLAATAMQHPQMRNIIFKILGSKEAFNALKETK